MGTDSFIGSIECRGGLSIFIVGDGMGPRGCASPGVGALDFRLNSGHPIQMCAVENPGPGSSEALVRKLILDVGAAHIVATVRSPQDAFFLMKVALSFEAERLARHPDRSDGPANKQMQRTRPAQAIAPRR
jgi:hypothetical protein